MVGTQPWCGLAPRPGTIPQEQKGSLAVSLKINSLPWKLEEASPAAAPETDWGMEPEQHFCVFLSFLVFPTPLGSSPLPCTQNCTLFPALGCCCLLLRALGPLSFVPCPTVLLYLLWAHVPGIFLTHGPRLPGQVVTQVDTISAVMKKKNGAQTKPHWTMTGAPEPEWVSSTQERVWVLESERKEDQTASQESSPDPCSPADRKREHGAVNLIPLYLCFSSRYGPAQRTTEHLVTPRGGDDSTSS